MKLNFYSREESGSDLKENTNNRTESTEFERDMDDLLRPGVENKYVYENIESEYYRTTMKSLEYVAIGNNWHME